MQKSENEKFALDKGEASLLPSSSAPEGIRGNRGMLKGAGEREPWAAKRRGVGSSGIYHRN